MKDEDKTKEQLIEELVELRRRNAGLVSQGAEHKKSEREVSYERDLMQTLLDNIPDYVYFKDRDMRFVRASNAFFNLFKCSLEDIIGKTDEELFPKDVAEETSNDDRRIIETGIPLVNKVEGGGIDGDGSWVLTTKMPWYDKEGNIVGVFGISRDITERKMMEEELKKSEERYALAQSVANIGSWDWDILREELYWSEQIEKIFGFKKGGFSGTYEAFIERVHPEDRQNVIDKVNGCLESGADYYIEHRLFWPDGSVRWCSATGRVLRDDEGKAIRMIGITHDITDSKMVEEEIESLARFPSENPNPVLRVAKDGTVLYANEASKSLFDYWGSKASRSLSAHWKKLIKESLVTGQNKVEEVKFGDRIF